MSIYGWGFALECWRIVNLTYLYSVCQIYGSLVHADYCTSHTSAISVYMCPRLRFRRERWPLTLYSSPCWLSLHSDPCSLDLYGRTVGSLIPQLQDTPLYAGPEAYRGEPSEPLPVILTLNVGPSRTLNVTRRQTHTGSLCVSVSLRRPSLEWSPDH